MGTWITHIRIAENLLSKFDGLDPTAFAYGNLAPDSGKPNQDWTEFDPPKTVTHFLHKNEGEHKIRDLEYYQKYLRDYDEEDSEEYSFRLGYFFHLLTDSLWMKNITHTTKEKYQSELLRDKTKAWENIKADWYTLDHIYLMQNPESLYWKTISLTQNYTTTLPFIVQDSLNHSMDYLRDFYNNPSDDFIFDREFPYLTQPVLDTFIEDSTEIILEIYLARGDIKDSLKESVFQSKMT